MRENSKTCGLAEVPLDDKEKPPANYVPPEGEDRLSAIKREESSAADFRAAKSEAAAEVAATCAVAAEANAADIAQSPSEERPSTPATAKQGGPIARLILKLCFGNRRLAEIARFVIDGGIATLADFVASGIVLYLFAPSLYTQFTDIFNSESASVVAQCVSTGAGFLVGVVVNYLISIFFVFEEKGNSRTALGFILFVVLSAGGLAINVVGMYLFVDFAGWNYWLIKILLTCVVLVYNYITRKFIIFKKRGK